MSRTKERASGPCIPFARGRSHWSGSNEREKKKKKEKKSRQCNRVFPHQSYLPMSDVVDAARRILHDVRSFQIPRLSKCDSSLADQQQLAAELREDLDRAGRLVEQLAVAIADEQDDKARLQLETTVNELRDSLCQ